MSSSTRKALASAATEEEEEEGLTGAARNKGTAEVKVAPVEANWSTVTLPSKPTRSPIIGPD